MSFERMAMSASTSGVAQFWTQAAINFLVMMPVYTN
jgi:hypothetical protein